MAWDTARTKQLLLDAAVVEFSTHGPDGARIDRVAAAAGVNKERIYRYFGSKNGLFTAVLESELAQLAAAVPLTAEQAEDLGDYAGRVFDYHLAHPHLLRLMSWESLQDEQPMVAEGVRVAHYGDKVAAVAAAQDAGAVQSEIPATHLFATVMAMTTWWFTSRPTVHLIMSTTPDDTIARRRAALVQMVNRLVDPSRS